MARITVVDTSVNSLYIQDIDRKQRQFTTEPPGQDRYIKPIDKDALKAELQRIVDAGNGGTVSDAEVDNVISGTVGDGTGSTGSGDDVSLSNIKTVAEGDISDMEVGDLSATSDQQAVQDILSYGFIETGKFKLSFDRGTIDEWNTDSVVKVFPDDAAGLYSL